MFNIGLRKGQAKINLGMALGGAYSNHPELGRLLSEHKVTVLEQRPDNGLGILGAKYAGQGPTLGEFSIKVSQWKDSNGGEPFTHEHIELRAKRDRDFGEMGTLLEVVRDYAQLLQQQTPS